MVPRGLEPRTLRLLAVRSNQLSYETRGSLLGIMFRVRASQSIRQKVEIQVPDAERCGFRPHPAAALARRPRL